MQPPSRLLKTEVALYAVQHVLGGGRLVSIQPPLRDCNCTGPESQPSGVDHVSRSEIFSAIIMVGRAVLCRDTSGMIEASAM